MKTKRVTGLKPFEGNAYDFREKERPDGLILVGKQVAKQLLEKPPKGAFFKGMGA